MSETVSSYSPSAESCDHGASLSNVDSIGHTTNARHGPSFKVHDGNDSQSKEVPPGKGSATNIGVQNGQSLPGIPRKQSQSQLLHAEQPLSQSQPKLGTLRGVYFPCIQSIIGVILFLRLTNVTSQAGCLHTTLILIISTASTLLTWSSLSAIVTNGTIKAGGPYYIISRTLGVDIGCSLGLLYYLGNTLSGSMFALGAVEAVHHSIQTRYARMGYGYSGHVFPYDVQVTSIVLVLGCTFCVHFGTKYVNLFSSLFLGVTIVSVFCMCLGCVAFALGIHDGSLQSYDRTYMENTWPRYEPDPFTGVVPTFFSSLALLYPSVTGILAGMSKSGNLKNPSLSIPKGMFWAIISSSGMYISVCWLFGMFVSNRTLKVDKFVSASLSYPHEFILRGGVVVSCLGLILGCMSTAPGLLAAISFDDVVPFLSFLRPQYEGGSSSKALWFTALLVAIPTLAGNLDHISPIVTIFYLLMYAGVNASTCISGYVRPPGFRPTFRYYHWSISFGGLVWCLGLSFLISGVATFCALLSFLLLHAYVKKSRRLAATGKKWGTVGSAVRYNIVTSALNSLAKGTRPSVSVSSTSTKQTLAHSSSFSLEETRDHFNETDEEWVEFNHNDFHAKNWRPQLLTFVDVDHVGNPENFYLLSLAAQLQQTGQGINAVVSIIDRAGANVDSSSLLEDSSVYGASEMSDTVGRLRERGRNEDTSVSSSSRRSVGGIDHYETIQLIRRSKASLICRMREEGLDGFVEVSSTDGNFFEAVWSAVIHTGLGPLSPNSILMSFPSFLSEVNSALPLPTICNKISSKLTQVELHSKQRKEEYLKTIRGILNLGKAVIVFKGSTSFPKSYDVIPGGGTIDIWWIVHDGGLLLLLPFLLSKHSVWAGGVEQKKGIKRQNAARLRLFAVTTTVMENPEKLRNAVTDHLESVRIHATVTVVDSLAGTMIAEFMRDLNSLEIEPGASASGNGAANLSDKKARQRECNRLLSLNQHGISTQHMTLGEVFSSEAYEVPYRSLAENGSGTENEFSFSGVTPEGLDDNLYNCGGSSVTSELRKEQGLHAASMLNDAIREYGGGADLVVTNLPLITRDQPADDYFEFLGAVCKGIENIIFVRGSGAEVITAYA